MTGNPITVAIADDSPLVRRALRAVLSSDPRLAVVGEASTGHEAVALAKALRPRVLTLDLDMPELDGLTAIEQIMALAPTRILVITDHLSYRGNSTLEALSRGALDVIPKPTLTSSTRDEAELRERICELANVRVVLGASARHRSQAPERSVASVDRRATRPSFVVMGASTGGPRTLSAILGSLPVDYPLPIVIVQHLAGMFGQGFVEWLGTQTPLRVREGAAGQRLEPGVVDVVTRGPHMTISVAGRLEPSVEPPRGAHRPAVDVLFESAAQAWGARAMGVLLTGMGRDGAVGLKAIADAGGCTIAQDEASAVVFGMPKVAIELGAARHVLSIDGIGAFLRDVWRAP